MSRIHGGVFGLAFAVREEARGSRASDLWANRLACRQASKGRLTDFENLCLGRSYYVMEQLLETARLRAEHLQKAYQGIEAAM